MWVERQKLKLKLKSVAYGQPLLLTAKFLHHAASFARSHSYPVAFIVRNKRHVPTLCNGNLFIGATKDQQTLAEFRLSWVSVRCKSDGAGRTKEKRTESITFAWTTPVFPREQCARVCVCWCVLPPKGMGQEDCSPENKRKAIIYVWMDEWVMMAFYTVWMWVCFVCANIRSE